MSDDVPEWALREARGKCACSECKRYLDGCYQAQSLAHMLTEAHERGVREERERAVGVLKRLADSNPWPPARAAYMHGAHTIDPGTPGDTEGADPTTEGGEDG